MYKHSSLHKTIVKTEKIIIKIRFERLFGYLFIPVLSLSMSLISTRPYSKNRCQRRRINLFTYFLLEEAEEEEFTYACESLLLFLNVI